MATMMIQLSMIVTIILLAFEQTMGFLKHPTWNNHQQMHDKRGIRKWFMIPGNALSDIHVFYEKKVYEKPRHTDRENLRTSKKAGFSKTVRFQTFFILLRHSVNGVSVPNKGAHWLIYWKLSTPAAIITTPIYSILNKIWHKQRNGHLSQYCSQTKRNFLCYLVSVRGIIVWIEPFKLGRGSTILAVFF